jgi:ABC-type Fe3+-hydroxamate transport system substrate-binding protein
MPSQTELLYELGLENAIVGITRFCVHPEQALNEKRVVGGTKKIVEKRIKELQPDLIICNKEENTKEIVAFCESLAPTYVSDISTLEDSLEMIQQVGLLTGTLQKAEKLSSKLQADFKKLPSFKVKKRALYLIWKNPYMSIGHDTFIHDMMTKAGFENVMKDHKRYPQLELQDIVDLQPEVILLSSEPYNFKVADQEELMAAFKDSIEVKDPENLTTEEEYQRENENQSLPQCITVDGELFSWYGSRLLKAPAYFEELHDTMVGADSV